MATRFAVDLRFEDALIVLRYARHIAAGDGFVFNAGERVLGVTTPLHALVSAAVVAVAGEARAPAVQNLLGVAAWVAEGFLAGLLACRLRGPAAGVLAGALTLGGWTLSYLYFGMEVHLFAALALLAVWLLLERRDVALGWTLGLAFLARYDAALLALLAGAVRWHERWRAAGRPRGGRELLRCAPWGLAWPFAAATLPWLVFATLYFGSPVPQTLAAKEGYVGAVTYLHHVSVQVKRALEAVVGAFGGGPSVQDALAWVLPLLALAGLVAAMRRDPRALLLAAYPALHVLAYAVIGADPLFTWHTWLVYPFLFVLLAAGADRLAALAGRRAAPAIVGLLVLGVVWHLAAATRHPFVPDPQTRTLQRAAAWLDERYGPETRLLHPAIGIVGWGTDLAIVDQAGLVTPGLEYFDGSRHTPVAAALAAHRPDLVLLLGEADPALAEHGYRRVESFRGFGGYQLWERPPAAAGRV